ncbi:class I SAM-dependent methyltransferase [Microbacterium rhizomatis]|uniref:Methyltransferase domain-containing protein n=1 Tax=Microbacterium rhizomatis TaxID=1631477 RepID=A0A5J5J373_9MICO|nr:class I SAM-dependent methyltransferase [Microbacterium rhizomatis]KAA9110667.1 methyltransferase domain-containing protein [Microbacterium rhizomatis]
MIDSKTTPTALFEQHALRGRFNAAFFRTMNPYLEKSLGPHKRRVFADLPDEVVEIGAGTGANLRHLAPGSTLIAVEPNRFMHQPLRDAARRHGVHLNLRERMAEETGLLDQSVDAVISSLVLCSVLDPSAVLAEIRRVLRPGGTFRFVEHVVAAQRTPTRTMQRIFRRPWAWTFEGCSCERDLESSIRSAGFATVEIERYRIHSPFMTFNTQIAGVATA